MILVCLSTHRLKQTHFPQLLPAFIKARRPLASSARCWMMRRPGRTTSGNAQKNMHLYTMDAFIYCFFFLQLFVVCCCSCCFFLVGVWFVLLFLLVLCIFIPRVGHSEVWFPVTLEGQLAMVNDDIPEPTSAISLRCRLLKIPHECVCIAPNMNELQKIWTILKICQGHCVSQVVLETAIALAALPVGGDLFYSWQNPLLSQNTSLECSSGRYQCVAFYLHPYNVSFDEI